MNNKKIKIVLLYVGYLIIFPCILLNINDNYINKILLYTDGLENEIMYVEQNNEASDTWTIAIDIIDMNDKVLYTESIYHELFHVATLNNKNVSEEECSNCILVRDLYIKEASILSDFYDQFYSGKVKDGYVSEYAKVDMIEDAAESFSYYVLGYEKNYPAEEISYQKIMFFDKYQECKKIRNDYEEKYESNK